MNYKVGRALQCVDFLDGLLECCGDVGVRGFVEADVAIADLNEAESSASAHLVIRHLTEGFRAQYPACSGPDHASSRPSHALQKSAAVHSISIRVFFDSTSHILFLFETRRVSHALNQQ